MSIRTYFEHIADAIRTKDTSIINVTPGEMPDAILNIPSGSTLDLTKINLVGLYCTKRRGGNYGYCQVSDLRLSDINDNDYIFPSDRIASEWGGYATGQNEFAFNMFDNNLNTKAILQMYPSNAHPFGWFVYLPNNTIDCTIYNKWSWYTANDSDDRDPVSFGLILGSGDITDKLDIACVDFQNDYTVTTSRKTLAYSGIISEVNL